LTVAARLGLLMSWCGTESAQFDETLVGAESIEHVEKETVKLLANIKGDRPWMTALKQRSKEIKAAKASKSPQPPITYLAQNAGGKKAPPATEHKTKPAAAENTKPDEASQPQGTDVPSADAAASSAEAKPSSPASNDAAQPQPPAAKEEAPDSRYVPTCDVGDIVRVKAFRSQYNGFKAKVLIVLTGGVRVEMLDGPTVGTKEGINKFKFLQVTKLTDEEAKPEPEKREDNKEKKSTKLHDLNEWLKVATDDVP